MKDYRYILISSIIIFMITVVVHFVYDILNFDIIALIFPTNESIFQHMKMIFTSFFIFYVVANILRRRFKLNNLFLTNFISVTVCISFFLLIYLPIRFRYGEIMIFTFVLLFLSIMLGQYVSCSLLKKENSKSLNIFSLIMISIIFIIFAYLTFNPIHNDMFWDPENETYERVIK